MQRTTRTNELCVVSSENTVQVQGSALKTYKKHIDKKYIFAFIVFIISMSIYIFLNLFQFKPYKKIRRELTLYNYSYSSGDAYLDKYNFANDYDFAYLYGDDMEEDIIKWSYSTFINKCPKSFRMFLEEGGTVVLSNSGYFEMLKKYIRYEASQQNTGLYTRKSDGYPIICINYKTYENDDAKLYWGDSEIHELAHYIDDVYGYSKTEEFNIYFEKYAESYNPISNVTKGYQTSNNRDFFAILFNDIFKVNDVSTLDLPEDLYSYMKKVFKETENKEI